MASILCLLRHHCQLGSEIRHIEAGCKLRLVAGAENLDVNIDEQGLRLTRVCL